MIGLRFMRLGILSLAVGMFFGVIGGFQFLFPDFIKELLFTKTIIGTSFDKIEARVDLYSLNIIIGLIL